MILISYKIYLPQKQNFELRLNRQKNKTAGNYPCGFEFWLIFTVNYGKIIMKLEN